MACIPKYLVDIFLQKLKSGEINPEKLADMTSEGRHDYFKSFLGEANAKTVNSLFESKLLLKNQQQGIINWAKQVSGIKPEAQRDILSRVDKMTEILKPENQDAFLSDLVSKRLGVGVTMEEAGKIADLAKVATDKKASIPVNSPNGSKERIDYGTAYVLFKEYVGGLKAEAKALTPKEFMTSPGAWLDTIGGTTKSILSSLDNSFFGRQGLVTLITKPDIWASDFAKSWGDIGKELKGIDAMLPIKADVYSRQNALNGKYKKMELDIGIDSEEAFPTHIVSKIPLLGRLYKASESAYNGAALRMRADLADRMIVDAESMGIDVTDKNAGLGQVINSMTGRGKVNLTPGQSRAINVTVFSIKYVKANLDILLAPVDYAGRKLLGNMPAESEFARKTAAKNCLKVIGVISGVMAVAKMLDEDSVELDPRSSNFGKIMVGPKHDISVNITAGMGSLVTLASRIIPTIHNGKWGMWSKNSKGRYYNAWKGDYGKPTPVDFVSNYLTGKASPIARIFLDMWKGKNYQGQKITVGGELTGAITPISAQNLYQLAQSSANEDIILYAILAGLDLLGVNINVKQKRR